jgi:hypothetical protein
LINIQEGMYDLCTRETGRIDGRKRTLHLRDGWKDSIQDGWKDSIQDGWKDSIQDGRKDYILEGRKDCFQGGRAAGMGGI